MGGEAGRNRLTANCSAQDHWLNPADFAARLVDNKPLHCFTLERTVAVKAGVKTDNTYFKVYYSAE